MTEHLYVYGVMSAAGKAPAVPGVEDAPVRMVEHAGLAALVSPVAGDALPAARGMRAHWRVLQQATEDATVLPVRFGTVLEDEDAVRRELLEPNADGLVELLERLADRVQVTVRGEYREEELLRAVVADTPAIARLSRKLKEVPPAAAYYERIRLGELVAEAVERRRRADAEHALAELAPFATAAREEQATGASSAFNLSFLVERAGLAAFSEKAAALAMELSDFAEVRLSGPLPPYSFADGELAGAGAWA